MALTTAEKNLMLEMLANPVREQAQAGQAPQMFGMIKTDVLVAYRTKSDEEIRAELTLYSIRKKDAIQKQLVQIEANKARLNAELAKLPQEEPVTE